jgi:hypothetical protein
MSKDLELISPIDWLYPWQPVSPIDTKKPHAFESELKAELGGNHVIFPHAASAKAIAYRADCDDVLFWLPQFSKPFAIIHLIWHGKVENDPSHPETILLGSITEFIYDYMLPEHQMWKDCGS